MKIPGRIVNANHTAISMLAEGRAEDSLCLLRSTLSELKAVVQMQEQDFDKTTLAVGPMLGDTSSLDASSLFSVTISVKMRPTAVIHGGVFSFFNRAIAIQTPLAEGTVEGALDVTMDHYKMAAVLLYNAGLCSHLKGMESPTCLDEDFATALHFYRSAFSLLTETDAIMGISDHDALLLLSLANNMGHLNSNLFDEKASRVCLDVMQRLFPPAVESSTLNDGDALFFYLVTFLIPFDQLSASPAA